MLQTDSNIVFDTIGGQCPVQAEGTIDGHGFYFRARGESWSIQVNNIQKSHSFDGDNWTYRQEYQPEKKFSAG